MGFGFFSTSAPGILLKKHLMKRNVQHTTREGLPGDITLPELVHIGCVIWDRSFKFYLPLLFVSKINTPQYCILYFKVIKRLNLKRSNHAK